VEFTDLWGMPMFDTKDASACFTEVEACREAYPNHYIKVGGYNARYPRETTGLSFIVNRPKMEPGFRLDRTEADDRHIQYTLHSYAAETPHGTRDQGNGSGPEPD
jgi:ribulose-bisphosphate carboxylase small chain